MKSGLPFTICIVDDDEDDRQIIDDAFIELNYECNVKKFINGSSLMDYLGKIEEDVYPSLIVLDHTLPGMGALDIVEQLKGNPSYQSIPIVVYTSAISPTKKEELLSKGVYDCLTKGNSLSEIIQIAKTLRDLAEREKTRQ